MAEETQIRCYECHAYDEAAFSCYECNKEICTDCLFEHPAKCERRKKDPLHHYLSDNTGLTAGSMSKETAGREGIKRPHSLTEKDRSRIEANRKEALERKRKATEDLISNKRKAAIERKEAVEHNNERLKRLRNAFDKGEGQQEVVEDEYDDDSFIQQLQPDEPPLENFDEPDLPQVKKRRLTGKQKYEQVKAHVKEIKENINDKWTKHSQASSSRTVQKADGGKGKDVFTSFEVVDEHRSPKISIASNDATLNVTDVLKIHPTHHKMMIRHIVFCKWCGYNASRKSQKLVEVCPRKPKHNNVAQQLRRMMNGKHPDKKQLEWPGGLTTAGTYRIISLDSG